MYNICIGYVSHLCTTIATVILPVNTSEDYLIICSFNVKQCCSSQCSPKQTFFDGVPQYWCKPVSYLQPYKYTTYIQFQMLFYSALLFTCIGILFRPFYLLILYTSESSSQFDFCMRKYTIHQVRALCCIRHQTSLLLLCHTVPVYAFQLDTTGRLVCWPVPRILEQHRILERQPRAHQISSIFA